MGYMEGTITAIKAQKRNPNRVSIELDGEYAFGVSRIVGAWLKIGDHLTQEKITTLLEKDANEVVFQRALTLINHRPRTEHEIRQKLIEKGYTTAQIDLTVEKLRESNLVQDATFARMWVENRNQLHPRSRRLISYELRRKGIANELIDAALQDSEEDSELAFQAANQYARRLAGLDWSAFRKKLAAFLARRGFDYGTINLTVSRIWKEINLEGLESGKKEECEK